VQISHMIPKMAAPMLNVSETLTDLLAEDKLVELWPDYPPLYNVRSTDLVHTHRRKDSHKNYKYTPVLCIFPAISISSNACCLWPLSMKSVDRTVSGFGPLVAKWRIGSGRFFSATHLCPLIHHPTKYEPKIHSHSEVTERKGIKSQFLCFYVTPPYRTEKLIKSKNRTIYHVPLLDERTIKTWWSSACY
jgi:hypothetical protein